MIGDLHCHSKLSDGSTGLEDIVFYAKRAGLDVLSVTDHDTLSGISRAEILGKRYGLTVIPGVEISTFDESTGRRVHILCYLPHKPDRLAGLLNRTLAERRRSGEEMIRNVTTYNPVSTEHIMGYAASSYSTRCISCRLCSIWGTIPVFTALCTGIFFPNRTAAALSKPFTRNWRKSCRR